MRHLKLKSVLFCILIGLGSCSTKEGDEYESKVIRYDKPESSILKGVFIPSGKDVFYTSGTVASVKDETAEVGLYARYGNTYEQSVSALENIKATLKEADFELNEVFLLRVYLAPDRGTGEVDFEGWFKAYGEFFNNEELKEKVARSTIAVHSLAHPDLLVEIEAVAVKE